MLAEPSGERAGRRGARLGLAFGIGANLVGVRFVAAVIVRSTSLPWAAAILGLVVVSILEGLRFMVAGLGSEMLARARVPRPIALAAGVYAGTFVPTMFPWTTAGLASPWPVMLQVADVVGERGVAAGMALAAGLAASGVRAALDPASRTRGLRHVGLAIALLLVQTAYGEVRMQSVERAGAGAPHARVGLVQPSIGASTRWDEESAPAILEGLTTLTRQAEADGAELVVWPETAYPYRVARGSRRSAGGTRALVQPGIRGPILAGLETGGVVPGASEEEPADFADASDDGLTERERTRAQMKRTIARLQREVRSALLYNSVVVATREGTLSEPYDKRHLLWFGETVPLRDPRASSGGLRLLPGDHAVLLVAGPVRAAALVCYEDMLPAAGREASTVAPNLLVNVTNDAWFAGTAEPELHLRLAVPRSIEMRRDLVRAVNAGPTSWVDAAGRVQARASYTGPSTLTVDAALLDTPPTIYARFGDTPWALLALLLANLAVWRAARRR